MVTIKHSSPFVRNIWQMIAVLILSVIVFNIYIYADRQTDYEYENRLNSLLLANELRQSSDDLTRMVRTYVATNKSIYKEQYQKILDTRDGKIPYTANRHNIYLDLLDTANKQQRIVNGKPIALLERMRQAGLTDAEFAKLTKAKNNSDALTKIEFQAMELVESSEKDFGLALELLYNDAYHQAKNSIIQPIDEFYNMVNIRTTNAVYQANRTVFFVRIVFISLGICLLFMLWRLHKTLHSILGDSVDEVYSHISRIGRGDFSIPIIVGQDRKNSIFGRLGTMQELLISLVNDLQTSRNHLSAIIENEPECVKLIDGTGKLVEMNPAGLAMLEVSTLEEVQERNIIEYVSPEYRDSFMALFGQVMDKKHGVLEFEIQGRKGTNLWVESHAAPIYDADGKVISLLAVTRNITERKANEERLLHLANYDTLTGLPNRTKLSSYFISILSMSKRQDTNFALLILDLDYFKEVNDTLGHNIGDKLLIEVTTRLKSALREEDMASRFGGDEFIILLPNTNGDEAEQVAQKLLENIRALLEIDSHPICVTLSVGIAIYPYDGDSFETLYKNSDDAMYQAKQNGKDRYCLAKSKSKNY